MTYCKNAKFQTAPYGTKILLIFIYLLKALAHYISIKNNQHILMIFAKLPLLFCLRGVNFQLPMFQSALLCFGQCDPGMP